MAAGTASCCASRFLASLSSLESGLGTVSAITSQEPRDPGLCGANAPGRLPERVYEALTRETSLSSPTPPPPESPA